MILGKFYNLFKYRKFGRMGENLGSELATVFISAFAVSCLTKSLVLMQSSNKNLKTLHVVDKTRT